MGFDAIFVVVTLGVAVLLFVTERVRSDIVAVLVVCALTLSGILSPQAAFAGFSSNAVIAIASLLVIGRGLVLSGVVKWVADRLIRLAGGDGNRLMLLSTGIPGILSGFINIVAAVVIFIPAVLRMARQADLPASRLLLPMAVAGLMGANLSLIGASHNLVVNGLLQDSGAEGFGFFEFTALGAVLVAITLVYALVAGRHVLPREQTPKAAAPDDSRADLIGIYQLGERLWEIHLEADSSVAGKPLREVGIGRRYGLSILAVFRDGKELSVEDADCRLQADDVLAVGGRQQRLDQLLADHVGLKVLGQLDARKTFTWSLFELVEVTVPPRSPVIGRSLRELGFREETGLTAIALWRDGRPLRTDARERPLQAGDGLLLFGARVRVRAFDPQTDFLWLQQPRQAEAPPELRRFGPAAAAIFLAVILSAAFELAPIAGAALLGAAAMALIGLLSPARIYDAIEWKTIVLIGGLYPLGAALEQTGAAAQMAELIVGTVGDFGPRYALLAVTLLTMILTQPMHNAVAAVVMTPTAIQTAEALGSNPKAFAVAVIVGASASFLLPVGHPAPQLVQGPGGYTTRDFVKFGLPLTPLILAVAGLMIPLLWPL